MKEKVLEIKDLSLPYIFKNLSISIYKNDFITISGPNNCGKTTLIKVLSGEIDSKMKTLLFSRELNTYKLAELSKLIEYIIPNELSFTFNTLEEEIDYIVYKDNLEKTSPFYKNIIKELKINKYQKSKLNNLSNKEKIKIKLGIALLKKTKVLLLDDIFTSFSEKERKELFLLLDQYRKENASTIVMTTSNLEDSLSTDYLYIIDGETIVLEGSPLKVLEKDNVINKLGLDLPFLIDLSVKLRDYDLIEEIELDTNRLVNKLWN